MTTRFVRSLARVTFIAALAAGLGGCETIGNTLSSLDPSSLWSDDTPAVDQSAAGSPDLAAIPSAPPTSDDQSGAASSLAASGAQAQYNADALRAGTEASAPPPGAAPPASQLALAAPSADAPPTADAPSAARAPAVAAPKAPASAPPIAVSSAPAQSAPAQAAVAPPIPVSNAPASSAAAPVQMAALPPSDTTTPAGAEPAVPAVPPRGAIRSTIMTPPVMSDAALGFMPSSAPPLDPSVSNFVSQPILARYSRTAALAGVGSGSANAAVPVSGSTIVASTGGLAGLGGAQPTAVILFPGDGATLTVAARAQIRAAVAAYKAAGGAASIRVVGHASSRTADMPVEKHLELIFEKSHKRALAVMQELVRQGVPADRVQVDAVGDSQPVYYESMPKGEEGNRRAEIFVQ